MQVQGQGRGPGSDLVGADVTTRGWAEVVPAPPGELPSLATWVCAIVGIRGSALW